LILSLFKDKHKQASSRLSPQAIYILVSLSCGQTLQKQAKPAVSRTVKKTGQPNGIARFCPCCRKKI
jgi:hypothetical protein